MRLSILSVLTLLCVPACAPVYGQSVIRTLAWELDTARPATVEWPLVRGETVDLECRYLAGASAMDVRGATVVLHALTNGMAEGYSFQVTGRVGRVASTNLAAVGWVTVRVRPGADLPTDVKRCTFSLETQLSGARNLVATGLLRLSGDPTGAAPASVLLYQYDQLGSAQAVRVELAQAVQAIGTNTAAQITASTGDVFRASALTASGIVSAAIANLPPSSGGDASRLVGTNSWIDGDGNRWRIEQQAATNDNQLVMWDSAYDWLGPVTLDRMGDAWFFANPVGDEWFQVQDVYAENVYYASAYNPEVGGPNPPWVEATPADLSTFPKTYVNLATGHTGWVDRAVSYQTVTNRTGTLVTVADLPPAGVSSIGGAATNLSLYGTVSLRNTQATNLVLRLSFSNDTLIAEHIAL